MIETTHAITILAPPSEVWRWLVQAGYRGSGRAGWYTDTPLIDPLVDLVAADMERVNTAILARTTGPAVFAATVQRVQ